MSDELQRLDRRHVRCKAADATLAAHAAWAKAPLHVRTMAAPFVAPLLAALAALDREQQLLAQQRGE